MSDAATHLEQDHRKVESLFERYRNGDRNVVGKICEELLVHTAIEEKVVYPVLPRVSGGDELKREAEHEHQEVEQAIKRLQSGTQGAEVETCMETIIAGVTHHVEEEERDVLPKLRSELGAEQMTSLGQQLLTAKRAELSAMGALDSLTKDELYQMAQVADVTGRSDMTKGQLVDALQR